MIKIEKKEINFKYKVILERSIFIVLLFTTLYVIFSFSNQSGQESSGLSKKVTEIIVNIISKIKSMDESQKLQYIKDLHPIVRKLAHFSIYAVVGFSLMGLFNTYKIQNKYKVIWTVIIGAIYALSDEFHQRFIPGRGPSLKDVGIDTLGVIFGMLVIMCFIKIINKRKIHNDLSKKV